jgi:apyrase
VAGRDEGVYEWVAANYARGIAQSGAADTIGVLTLGDKSAQVLHCTSAMSSKSF